MYKNKDEIKKEIEIIRLKNLGNLKWSLRIKNDDFIHLNSQKVPEILKNPKWFNEKEGFLDLLKTKYEVIDEFCFHSLNIKKIKLPKNLVILGKYAFANNLIDKIDLSEYQNLEIIEDYCFAYNKINHFIQAPNVLLFTKKSLYQNPINKTFKN